MLSDKNTMDNINSSLQIITLSFICLQLLPHSHMNFCHVPHPCCHLSAFGTICPLALSLSLSLSLSAVSSSFWCQQQEGHTSGNVNEVWTKKKNERWLITGSSEAQRSTGTSENMSLWL